MEASKKRSYLLKLSLFATGLSGIVSEYMLSTTASYFLGDSVFQWTITVSLMLFSMGIGSNISKFFTKNLLSTFIKVEYLLSLIVSFSVLISYYFAGFPEVRMIAIYGLAIFIGILIGLEIPLVMRLNEEFEELKINIANVLEKDYYGSLAGGMFFAFVGLPIIGLQYTPFLLGLVNFAVATLLLIKVKEFVEDYSKLKIIFAVTATIILAGAFFSKEIIFYAEQNKYNDLVVFQEQTKYQKLTLTKFKDNYWLYINGNLQFSTYDEVLYHEPLVHPALNLTASRGKILILGGGDGCALREVVKYKDIQEIILIDLDRGMTDLGKNNAILVELNKNAFSDKRLTVINKDAYNYLEDSSGIYDVIICDFPDPRSADLARLYSKEFYELCKRSLSENGILVTQAGSPYSTPYVFESIQKTIESAGFSSIRFRNHVPTMGEWGFILASKSINEAELKKRFSEINFNGIETKWLNNEAIPLILSFGKNYFFESSYRVEVNSLINPVIIKYFDKNRFNF